MLNNMFKASILITALALGGATLFAQDAELTQYQTWMKAAVAANGALRAAVTAKDDAAIKDNAKKEAEAFDSIAKFWAGKHKEDAQKFAETARDGAQTVAAAKTPEDQAAALQAINATCRGCHTAYRDGSAFKK